MGNNYYLWQFTLGISIMQRSNFTEIKVSRVSIASLNTVCLASICREYHYLLFPHHQDLKIFHHIWSITHHLISRLY